jgi:hypothetical protein
MGVFDRDPLSSFITAFFRFVYSTIFLLIYLFILFYRLERRFLERVAQTNRVKSSGVAGAGAAVSAAAAPPPAAVGIPMGKPKEEEVGGYEQPTPAWLQPPSGYQHGHGASFAASNQSGSNSRAAAAGRALLEGLSSSSLKDALERQASGSNNPLASHGSAGMFAMQEMQRRASQQNMYSNSLPNQHHNSGNSQHSHHSNHFNNNSASNLLSAAAARSGNSGHGGGGGHGLSQSAMAQLAQNASAARMAGLSGVNNNSSMNNLMLKTGLSREQISQLALDRGLSSGSLSNMIQRQNSFDALMSLDFQSLQSIDNLANLIQTGGGTQPHVPESGMKNADFGFSQAASRHNAAAQQQSSGDLSSAARRLASASAGRMESFLRNFSSNSVRGGGDNNNGASSASLAAHMQNHGGGGGGNMSAASLLASGSGMGGMSGMSAVDLANLLRQDSQTGLSALRMQDGLNQRSSSVDDFLSLVAAGDIPHQDPSLLNVPLMQQPGSQESVAKQLLAQQFLQASASGNTALANALASRSFGNMSGSGGSSSAMHPSSSAAALMMAHQARAHNNNSGSKRTLNDMGNDGYDDQRGPKR